jgi:hypothetical protein
MSDEVKPGGEGRDSVPGAGAMITVESSATPNETSVAAQRSPGRVEALLRRFFDARTVLWVTGGLVVVLLLLVGGTYFWNIWTVRGLEREFAAERDKVSSAQRQALNLQARDLLRLASRPLAWSVRAELLRGNVGQVDDYFREFVREPGVNSVLLVGADGKILLASNRKLETQAADAHVSKALLEAKDATLEESGTQLRLGVPVMGFDRRLGLLVIDYDPVAR